MNQEYLELIQYFDIIQIYKQDKEGKQTFKNKSKSINNKFATMTQDSGESSIAINDYIQLNDTRSKSIKKLNKSKPRQQISDEIVFQGFDELVRGIKQQKMNNQMWDSSFHEEKIDKNAIEPEKKNPSLDVGFYLKKMLGILKEDKKDEQKTKLSQKYNPKQQIPSKKKKQKSRKQQKEPSQKKSRKKRVQQKKPELNNKNIKQKKKIDYVNYDNVQMENSLSRSEDSKVYNNFKVFEQHQRKHNHQLKTIQRLQKKLELANEQEKRKGSKKVQRKQREKKQSSEPKSKRKKKEPAQKPSKNKQSNQQNKKDMKETINKQKQVKNHPKLQKFKTDPTKIQSANKKQKIQQVTTRQQNRPFKGKKQRTDPRKQSLKILVQVFSNKLKLKQFSSKITPNLFSNELQFATAYLCSQINSKYYSRCLITPYDHRAISIVLSHKFPKEYLMDQSPPYLIQSSQNSQLNVFYNKIYQITQLQYYQEYLKTILRYNRELPRSFRFNFDEVMKQRMLKYQTFQERQLRKQIEKLLESVGKNQRQNELMFEIKRDMLEKSRLENQQQLQRQKKIKVATKNINLNKKQNQKQVKQREGLTIIKKIKEREKKKAISQVYSKKQNKKRVIVIDQRAKFLDLDGESDPNFQSSQSQDQQISDSMERSNSLSQGQGKQNSSSGQSSSLSKEQKSNSSPQDSSQNKSNQVSDEEQESVVQISDKQEEKISASPQQSQDSNQNSSKSSKKQSSQNQQSCESFDKQMQELIVQNESSDSASVSQNSLSLGEGISQASESIGSSSNQNRKNKKKVKKNQEQSLESVSISMEQQQSD